MSLEARVLLADVKKHGASVYLKDGAPCLKGKIPDELKAQLKSYREEIVKILSPNENLFAEEKIKQPTALDVIGRKDRVKAAENVEHTKVVDMWALVVCERCYKGRRGRIAVTPYGYLGTEVVMEVEGKWYCYQCYDVALAEKSLRDISAKAPAIGEVPDRIGLQYKWDMLDPERKES